MTKNAKIAAGVLAYCRDQGVSEYCIAAGARNAPLALALLEGMGNPAWIYHFFDERAAAFFALGRSLSSRRPVAVVTTSGTAVAELLPAMVEARYQAAPLVAITADRPAFFRGSGAPQAIEQVGIFGVYAESVEWADGVDLPSIDEFPIHLNVPFAEPASEDSDIGQKDTGAASVVSDAWRRGLGSFERVKLEDFIGDGEGLGVVVGSLHPDEVKPVAGFLHRLGVPVRAEPASNLRGDPRLDGIEVREGKMNWGEAMCQMRRILRIGGVPVGRWWRNLNDSDHEILNLSPSGHRGVSRNCTSVRVGDFSELDAVSGGGRRQGFRGAGLGVADLLEKFPKSEPALIRLISELVHGGEAVFLGNSLPIRIWDLAAADPAPETAFFANRGANGIDGALSTALGIGADYPGIWAVVGDLTALYDLSAPWVLGQIPKDTRVRIVVVNNGGGRIFSQLPALAELGEEKDAVVQNRHGIEFGHWAKMWGLGYIRAASGEGLKMATFPERVVVELVPDEAETEGFWKCLRDR